MKTVWRPRPLILGSMVLHALALVALVLLPQAWPWPIAAVLANHALLTLLTLLPNGQLLGGSLSRLPPGAAHGQVALTFDDGPDPDVTPRILDLLERHDARATFFCIGERAARHPELMRAISARGHAIGNHTMHHPLWFSLGGSGTQRREWLEAQAVLRALVPLSNLARAPLGLRSPFSDRVFHQLGLRHVGWTRRAFDTRFRDPARLLARITRSLGEGDIILLHDGNSARDSSGEAVSIRVLEALLPLLAARGLSSIRLDGVDWGGDTQPVDGVRPRPSQAHG